MDAINVNVLSEIQAARQRWAEKQEWIAEHNRHYREELRSKALSALALQDWLQEYVGEIKRNGDQYTAALHLPSCSPIQIVVWEWGTLRNYTVLEPVVVGYEEKIGWRVTAAEHGIYNSNGIDEAIDLAASFGESWHAMQAEADRRNAEGLGPPAPEPSTLESALEALKIFRQLRTNPMMSDQAIAALSLVAIVEQLNLLNDNLMKMDR